MPQEISDSLTVKLSGDYYAVLYSSCENIHIETNHLKVQEISVPVFSFNYPDKLQYCESSYTSLKTSENSLYHYRWYTNGTLNGDTTSSYIVTQTGKYKVEVSACTNSWVPSKEVEVDLVTLPVPQITADKQVYCSEDTAGLSANINTDPGYTINWYRDGNLLAKDKDLSTIKDTTAGNYKVIVSSNISACIQTSLPFQLAFTPTPVFAFNYPAELQYCSGTPVNLKAVGSANYQYRWYKDGTLTGDVTAALAITLSGKYKVQVSACANSWVSSKEVQVDFVQLPLPVITTDKLAYCIGDNATLSVKVPLNQFYTINWYRDNLLLSGDSDQITLTTNIAGNYTVSVVNNTVNSDGTICSQTSAVQSITFNPPPTVSIKKIVNTTLCDGQAVDLLAQYKGGTVKWSTGESTDQISVATAGTYKVTVTSPAGCQADTSIGIVFLPNPVFSVKDTTICTYKHQTITLTAPSGFAQYAWNGQTGGQTYQVSSPQTINLTVTDANGCQATQPIKVTDQCPEIWIPNAFTPNNDGINDTWVIEGLDNDQTALVRVYNRYGTLMYESKGYGTAWNGEYKGKKLPAGTYYYIVTAKNGKQKFSGSLTIIY
jgi:gliding motility-associated-like protein